MSDIEIIRRRGSRMVAVLAALLAVVLLAACGATQADKEEASAGGKADGIPTINPFGGDLAKEGTPKKGGVLTMGTDREAISFDPTVQNTNQAALAVYDSLMKLDDQGQPQPYLAKSMETTDDGKTWRMNLRPGVKFSDGTPLDAEAVVTNVQRHIDKATSPGHLHSDVIDSMRAVDANTVEFVLKEPFGSFSTLFALNFTSGNLGTIISPAALKKYGDKIGSNPVGAGPFVLKSWTRDSRMELTRNPSYWQEGMPYLDGLEFRPLPDTETRYASIENGDVDLIFGGYHTELVRGLDNKNLTVYYGPGNGAEYIYFNFTRPPFDDHRMREAFVRGIDLDALAATQFRSRMERADGWFGGGSPYHSEEAAAAWPKYDPEKAKALVEEYVAGGGSATVQYKTTNAPNRVAFAEFLQAQMAAVGITLQPQFFDLAQYSSSVVQSHDFQIAGWVGGPVDVPFPAMRSLMHTEGNSNYGGYSNPVVDKLLDKAAATTDEAERTKAYQQAELLTNQDIAIGYYSRGYLSTVTKPEVKGMVRYLTRDIFFATTWLDR